MFSAVSRSARHQLKTIINKRSYNIICSGNKKSLLTQNHYLLSPQCFKRQKMGIQYEQKRFNAITASTDGSEIPDDVKNFTIEEYHRHSTETFEQMLDELDSFFEENRIMEAEVDEEAGVMKINCSEGTYVINKQPPTKQIWLSSPISGPKRFDFHNNQWISLRDNIKLSELLQDEMRLMYGDFEWSKLF